jgi:putative SOS response-associated peptidase YedK
VAGQHVSCVLDGADRVHERLKGALNLTGIMGQREDAPTDVPDLHHDAHHALDESRPLFVFAGIWRPWTGVRKKAEGEMEHRLFSFLTCEANGVVAPIHPKAMPVILTTPDQIDTWLTAPTEIALQLQRPLPDDALTIVTRGERKDEAQLVA